MRALIMAGGEGNRMNLGEKPLLPICGKPMVAYIIDAFRQAGCDPVVAASHHTPMTQNWCRAHAIPLCRTEGQGFVNDMIDAVQLLGEQGPIMISVADIPGITPDIVHTILDAFEHSGKTALSTWIPASLVKSCRESMPYRERIDGTEACPAGINILQGTGIHEPQDELPLLLREPRLALNVNTRADLAAAEILLGNGPMQ